MLKFRYRGFLRDIQNIEQMVRNPLHFLSGNLGSSDIHTAIELHGIRVYAFTAKMPGKGSCERTLTGTGGTDNSDNRRL